ASLTLADSIVVDPHKHGLQPYGCGCSLFRDPAVGRFYKHDSPYTYFTSHDLHLGEISLECSRAGASAGALWATQQLLPLISDGEFANGLRCSREAAMQASPRLAQQSFTAAAHQDLHLALAQLPSTFFPSGSWADQDQQSSVTCLRSVLMKPEHLDWLD